MNVTFMGTGVALITPFTEDLKPDLPALRRLVDQMVEAGVNYLVVCGTTAESATLSPEEKKDVFGAVAEQNRGRLPLVAGIGGNNTLQVVKDLNETDLEGYQAVLSVTPYYNKPTQEGLFQHFKLLAEMSPLPLILYNVPSRTGSNMVPDTVIRLATQYKNIIGIKEASADMEQIRELLNGVPDSFMVISGDDLTAVPTVLEGGSGVISVLAQGVPTVFTEMIRLARKGHAREAFGLHQSLEALVELIFREGNPAGIKCLLNLKGVCLPFVRLPLVPASAELRRDLDRFLRQQL